MTKPIDGTKDLCMYLFFDHSPNDDKPYWCNVVSSGDHTEPCTIEDYWKCDGRKMVEESKRRE